MIKIKQYSRIAKKIMSYLAMGWVYPRSSVRCRVDDSYHAKFFSRWFIANKYVWNLPIRVEAVANLIKISDKEGDSIFLGRPERVRLYQHSVQRRLESVYEEYQLFKIKFEQDDIVIDIGANIGEVSRFLQEHHDVKVVAIEPEEKEFSALKRNLAHSRTDFRNCVVWKNDEEVDFFSANETGDSGVFQSKIGITPEKKKALTLPSLLKDCPFWESSSRIKLLKLEAEGAEPEILIGATSILDRIEYIAADCGAERGIEQESTLIPVMDILHQHGFRPISFGLPRAVMLFERNHF